jgi:hypothetical protein
MYDKPMSLDHLNPLSMSSSMTLSASTNGGKRTDAHFFSKSDVRIQVVNSRFVLSFPRCKNLPLDFRAEISTTIAKMSQAQNQEWGICFRARPLEKLLLEVLWQMRKKMTCFILRIREEKNIAEISDAILFCKERKIPFQFVDIDLGKVLANDHFAKFAVEYHAINLQSALDLVLFSEALRKNKYIVQASGFPEILKNQSGWVMQNSIENFASYFYAYRQNKNCCPNFFASSSGLYFSILNSRWVRKMVMNLIPDCTHFHHLQKQFISDLAGNLAFSEVVDDLDFESKNYEKQIANLKKEKVMPHIQSFGEVYNSLRPLTAQPKV